jgi:hypothetical protein
MVGRMTATPPEPDQPFGAGQSPYPGAQQPAAPYGSYPADPNAGPRQAPPAPPQPPSIALAVKLMWAGAVLSVLTLLYSLTTMGDLKDDIRAELLKNDTTVSQSTVDAAYAFAIVFAVLFGLVGAFLWAWMAWKNGQGRGWARIVATVFAGLNLLGLLFTAAGSNAETLSVVSSVISVLLAVVILILLWRKESSQFYEASAASRRLY